MSLVTNRIGLIWVLLCGLLVGCRGAEGTAWQNGYDASYKSGYQEGWIEGAQRGRDLGDKRGTETAENAVAAGTAWELYSGTALFAGVLGILVGISAQYVCLLICSGSEKLSTTMVLIPGIRSSLAFSILERRRALLQEFSESLTRIQIAKDLKISQVAAVKEAVTQRIRAASTLEELSRERVLEFAKAELDKIVSIAQQRRKDR